MDFGQTTSFSGVLTTEDGGPVPDTEVVLQHRGPDGWRRVATTTSDESGVVTFESAPVSRTVVVRLRSGEVHSEPRVVVMRPVLSLSSQTREPHGEGHDSVVVISVSSEGGQAGDQVSLVTRRGGVRVTLDEGLLDADGTVRLEATQSRPRRTYVVVLQPTAAHGISRESIRVTRAE